MDPAGEVSWGREVRITCSTAAELLEKTFILHSSSSPIRQIQNSSSPTATFTISKVNFDHDGSYWCQYEKTASGQTFTSSQSYPLSLRVTVSLQMPNISLTSPGAESVWGPGEADITRGYNFTFTCSITPESPQGRFFLIFSGDTKRRNSSAVNNSATFTFPAAQFEHQGNYSCVYVVTTSSHMFTSPESALITVAVKHSLLLLSLLVSGGIFLLLLFISVPVCLVQRRRKLRHPTVFFQTQTTSTERDEDNAEFDEDFYGQSIPSNISNQSEDEDRDDYENPVFDVNIHYPETGSRSHGKCISAKSESREEEMDEEDEGTSDDDDDYENVTEHFHQPVENDYGGPVFEKGINHGKPGSRPGTKCVSVKSENPKKKANYKYGKPSEEDYQSFGGEQFEEEENIYQNL
ncbi:Fc receptor-like protein 3 [Oryzias melastigma]|uniref:Fc receptor-like protein 3 n=1 Tax=Oryzias melastigma TaxID=30732 RepID=UPI00168D69F1|nr:Fc receptor-like protein 3 [Oryzias melastigma]